MTLIGALLLTFWYLLCDHLVTSEWSLHRRVYRQPPLIVKKSCFSIAHRLLTIVSYQPLGYKLKHLSGSILDVLYLISYNIVCLSNWLHNQKSLEHTNTSFSPTVTVYRTRWLPWEMFHDDVIKWKHFPRYWSFVRGIHRSRWIPSTKASDAELWCFLWSTPE